MKAITSVSGGRTSAYLAANYPSDHLLFALVRIEDKACLFPDAKLRQEVEDRIHAPFIATAEDDKIIYTMLDLEQFLGQKINWVTGDTYDEVIRKRNGGYVFNMQWRGCTTFLKLIPMAQWVLVNIGEPALTQIGFRANEASRADSALSKLNVDGFSEIEMPVAHKKTKTRWQKVNQLFAWQRPTFPLIEDGIYKQDVSKFWQDKPVRFADYNNCVGCFHRSSLFLAKMFDIHPTKMQWFANQEKKGTWRKGLKYENLKKYSLQKEMDFTDFPPCASGFCEVA